MRNPLVVVLATICATACPGSGDTTSDATTSATTATPASTTTGTASTTESPTTGSAPIAEPFTLTVLDKQWISGTGGWDTQHRDVDIDLGDGSFTSVTLIVDLESSCFPFADWTTPPPGQNWPARCDAFDRTMGFIVDPAAAPDDPPGFEALRAITPFGGPKHIEADLTDWANVHPGAHSLRSYINSWPDGAGIVSGSEGGWTLSVKLAVVPGPAPRNVLAAIPLYNADLGATTPDPEISFSFPAGTTRSTLSYTVSGHGGGPMIGDCIGPAEEFCKRHHHLRLDGAELIDFIPWRADCTSFCTVTDNPGPKGPAKYCAENPCGSIASVDAPRANWCPSEVVQPFVGPIKLGPGEHTFGFHVDGVVDGGSWTTAAIVYAYGD